MILSLNKSEIHSKVGESPIFLLLILTIILIFVILLAADSPYLEWDYNDTERAIDTLGFASFNAKIENANIHNFKNQKGKVSIKKCIINNKGEQSRKLLVSSTFHSCH